MACKKENTKSAPSTFQFAEQAVIAEIEGLLGFPVKLQIDTKREIKPWVFLSGTPLNKDGSRIDYSNTRYAEAISQGYFDDNFLALAQNNNDAERWSLTAFSLGATDAPFVDWPEKYAAPRSLFFQEEN